MKKRNIFLHIGIEKTGTTSIQEFLYENRDRLSDKGYHFIQSPGNKNNRALASYTMADHKFDDYFRDLNLITIEKKEEHNKETAQKFQKEISNLSDSINSIIISSEHFHSRIDSKKEITKLKSLLTPFYSNIKIICYLREQSETCTSLFSTSIKSGSPNDFSYLTEQCNINNTYYNYKKMLENWSEVFGKENIIVRVFDKSQLINNDLITDFLYILNINPTSGLTREKSAQNESLNDIGQALGLSINKTINNSIKTEKTKEDKAKLLSTISKNFKGKGITLSKENYKRIYNEFKESNREVNEKYLNNTSCLFKYKEPIQKTSKVDFDSIYEIIHQLYNSNNLPDHYADLFRDTALLYEKNDIKKALLFMELAEGIRPSGGFIKKKIIEYKGINIRNNKK
ncbi:sulfotransferase domain-containing protein [Amphritea pacifica]|uniref:sulfotransferase domain-containing protein n=1 Tax=Amphritea pacifica TaxID=2811233 RepID=UPI0019641EE6|nr:sulfotransferase domain-containing protein [Amphritea pacifica]MBN1008311.1 sulfotransferase domain-containing protein [Amphritea pacifica]